MLKKFKERVLKQIFKISFSWKHIGTIFTVVSDNIYSKEEQKKIRSAFLEIYLKAKKEKLPKKPDLDSQLEERVYPLGDSPRSVKSFLLQDGVVRNYYRDYAGLKPIADSVQVMITNIFTLRQLRVVKKTKIVTSKEGQQLLEEKGLETEFSDYETVAGTPLDSLRESYGLDNPLSLDDLITLQDGAERFAKDVSSRGYTKEWKAIADSITDLKLKGKFGNSKLGLDLRMMAEAWRYDKYTFFSRIFRHLILLGLMVFLVFYFFIK
tara:strand:+ start:3750 stop:4547 length:798 start_codon:yes stop_codon:yes gene_type:complete